MKKVTKKVVSVKTKAAVKKAPAPKAKTGSDAISLKKQYVKTSGKCKVTFRLPKEAALDAQLVNIVGDFNNWSITETPMQKLKNGDYKIVLELNSEREYKFRYLIDATKWENDWSADKYIPNGFGGEDSVVVV